jgi:hypothetical protein
MAEAKVFLNGDRAFAALELPASQANEFIFKQGLKAKRGGAAIGLRMSCVARWSS